MSDFRTRVLGGDGLRGWPTALHLSALGHDVVIVDNLSRRNIDNELSIQSLTPSASVAERLELCKEVSGLDIGFHHTVRYAATSNSFREGPLI